MKKLLICLQIGSAVLALLIFWRTKGVEYIFIFFFLSGFAGWCIFSKKKEGEINWIPRIFSILGIVIAITINHSIPKIERIYNKKTIVSFDKLVPSSKLQTPHKLLFAYDNSGAYLTDNPLEIDSKYLLNSYLHDIKTFSGLSLDSVKENYKNLLIARLCSDLINALKNEGKDHFRILKIGNPIKHINFSANDWRDLSKETVMETLKDFYSKPQSIERYSDLRSFYEIICECSKDKDFYTFFIYSDFVHDLDNKKSLQKDSSNIRYYQKKLIEKENLTQNIFYVPIPANKLKPHECWMLPDSEDKSYIRRYKINEMANLDRVPYKVYPTKDYLYYYRSEDNKTNYSAVLQLNSEKDFSNEEYHIYKRDNTNHLSIWDGDKPYDDEKNRVRNSTVKLIWSEKPTQPSKLEITHKGVHYFISCEYGGDDFPSVVIWILPIICLAVGIALAPLSTLYNKTKNKNKNS
jgi:hypothetical protein